MTTTHQVGTLNVVHASQDGAVIALTPEHWVIAAPAGSTGHEALVKILPEDHQFERFTGDLGWEYWHYTLRTAS